VLRKYAGRLLTASAIVAAAGGGGAARAHLGGQRQTDPVERRAQICGKQFFQRSIPIHIPQCEKLFLQQESLKPASERRKLPQAPVELHNVLSSGAQLSEADVQRINHESFNTFNKESLVPCKWCGRTFLPSALKHHRNACSEDAPFKPLAKRAAPTAAAFEAAPVAPAEDAGTHRRAAASAASASAPAASESPAPARTASIAAANPPRSAAAAAASPVSVPVPIKMPRGAGAPAAAAASPVSPAGAKPPARGAPLSRERFAGAHKPPDVDTAFATGVAVLEATVKDLLSRGMAKDAILAVVKAQLG
jgi:hypothetical protein